MSTWMSLLSAASLLAAVATGSCGGVTTGLRRTKNTAPIASSTAPNTEHTTAAEMAPGPRSDPLGALSLLGYGYCVGTNLGAGNGIGMGTGIGTGVGTGTGAGVGTGIGGSGPSWLTSGEGLGGNGGVSPEPPPEGGGARGGGRGPVGVLPPGAMPPGCSCAS
eukprot:365516-Chlamydomonas_euryale.AAC.12